MVATCGSIDTVAYGANHAGGVRLPERRSLGEGAADALDVLSIEGYSANAPMISWERDSGLHGYVHTYSFFCSTMLFSLLANRLWHPFFTCYLLYHRPDICIILSTPYSLS